MEDIKSKIDRLNHGKALVFYLFLFQYLFITAMALWAAPQVDTKGEMVLLIYLIINVIFGVFVTFLKVKPIKIKNETPEKYYQTQIDRTISSNDLAHIFYFGPMVISALGIWAIDTSFDNKVEVWIYVAISISWFVGLFLWFKMRKLIRREYKEIHGMNFLSFFHF